MEQKFRSKLSLSSPNSPLSSEDRHRSARMEKQASFSRQLRQYAFPTGQTHSSQPYQSHKSQSEYQFLVGRLIDQDTLERAEILARRWHVPPHQVMIAMGWITHRAYTEALADHFGLNYFKSIPTYLLDLPETPELIQASYRSGLFKGTKVYFDGVILSSASFYPSALHKLSEQLGQASGRVALASLHDMRYAITAQAGARLTQQAVDGLEQKTPGLSARSGLNQTQIIVLLFLTGFTCISVYLFPFQASVILAFLMSVIFLPVVLLRLLACIYSLFQRPDHKNDKTKTKTELSPALYQQAASPDGTLPVYTVLVPVFREKTVLPDLIQALLRLDYPRAKLDIKLIFEECDTETLDAAQHLAMPDCIEFIIVPNSHPRTKPKALNYAMQFARGDYVTIYDAEDQPEPDQLRKAVETFRNTSPHVVCLQARLNFYNASENWLTRQFSIEYASLFNGLLPTLQALHCPLPLGGTSNHFRMSALQRLCGWDAFNVTEDADLGMRLYRLGYRCQMLESVTYEEATCQLGAWIKQRTRWIKGWMQTYAVHMRSPLNLVRQLGLRGFLGFQTVIGGFILSALIHPIFCLYALYILTVTSSLSHIQDIQSIGWLALFNLCFGYSSAMLLGCCIRKDKKFSFLPLYLLSMPLYWLLISLSAYRALLQWIYAPFLWEKTTHGLSRLKPAYKVR